MADKSFYGGVRFYVEVDGNEELTYYFETISEAFETMHFVKDFFPTARFVLEPALH